MAHTDTFKMQSLFSFQNEGIVCECITITKTKGINVTKEGTFLKHFLRQKKVNNRNWQKTSSLYFDRKLTDYQTSSDYIEQLCFFKVNFATVF